MRKLVKICSVTITLSLAACGGASDGEQSSNLDESSRARCVNQVDQNSGTVVFCGQIDDKAVDFFKRNVTATTKDVVVTSASSFLPAAMEVADHLSKYDITLTIKDVCLYGCAHFIFLSADKVSLRPNSLVAFSHTSTSLDHLVDREGWSDGELFKQQAASLSAAEQDFYDRHDIDKRWLIEGYVRMQHECVVEEIKWDTLPTPTIYTKRKFAFWLPNFSDISQHTNIQIEEENWPNLKPSQPSSERQWLKALGQKYNLKNNIYIGGPPLFLDAYYDELLHEIPYCD